jgi:hypothetical protein
VTSNDRVHTRQRGSKSCHPPPGPRVRPPRWCRCYLSIIAFTAHCIRAVALVAAVCVGIIKDVYTSYGAAAHGTSAGVSGCPAAAGALHMQAVDVASQ